MNAKIRSVVLAAALSTLGACVYDPYYYGYPQPVSGTAATFDRSWNAAVGAMRDQGVQIALEDRPGGVIDGRRGNMTVRTHVMAQSDGRVRVEFNTGGLLSEDPGLSDRISSSYEARMGR
jgi:hypothetical protein